MKKWAVIASNKRDESVTPCQDKEQAINEAKRVWDYLTKIEQQTHSVIAGLINLDSDNNYAEVNGQIDADIYEIAFENGKIVED